MTIFDKIKTIKNKIFSFFPKKKHISNTYYKNSTTKYSMNSGCTMELSSATAKKKEEINSELKEIVKKYFNTPEKLIQFIKASGGKVYRIRNAEKFLSKIGEEEGFLTPLKGIKAIIINFMIHIYYKEPFKFSFKTKELFIFDVNNTEIYTIARALYKYYGYKNNLPGYDYKSQEIFKKVYNTKRHHSSPFGECSVEEMYACKEAIARDMESINFTIALSVEYENAKKAALKLESAGGANI